MTHRALFLAGGLALTLLPLAVTQAQTQTTPAASNPDSTFVEQAARAGLAEVQEGQLAEKKAHRTAVRSLAKTMVRDHDWINEKLTMIAKMKNIPAPTAPDDAQQQMISALQGARGSAFDRQFLDQQAAMHASAVQLFRTESEQGADPDLKAFAARVLPRLEEHRSMVEKLGGHPATS